MIKPTLSIITLNYNTKEITAECIKSVVRNTKKINFEMIVIDNGSTDGSYAYMSNKFSRYKNIELVKSSENLGFAKGNNLGIKKARGKYILLLNSDTVVEDNVLEDMIKWMDKHKNVGVATCMLKNEDGSVQGTGGYFPSLLRVFSWMTIEDIPGIDKLIKPFHPQHSKFIFKNNSFYEKKKEIDWVTGAFLLTRKEVIEQIGMVDEDYFMYTEDTDFCYRAKKAGWKVFYLPKWSIVHLGGKSSTREFPIISEFRSVKLFYKKHYPRWQFPILRVLLKIGSLWRLVVFGVIYGKEGMSTYAKAFKEA